MKISGNTILITGGGSGIGLALALALKNEGNDVVVAGRSKEKLEHARSRGLGTVTVDLSDTPSLAEFSARVLREHPRLNVVIHNAGIMKNEKMTNGEGSTAHLNTVASETIATNLVAPIVLTNCLLPHFLALPEATIVTVTSGLAYVPLAMTPTYGATKAGIHSFTESLRYQLRGTSVEVKELIPPYVRTGLMGDRQASDPKAMDLGEFVGEVLSILRETPAATEVAVKRVHPQRMAAYGGEEAYAAFFKKQNDFIFGARKEEWDAESPHSK